MGVLQGHYSLFVPGPPAKPGAASSEIIQFLMKSIRGTEILDLGGGNGAYSLELLHQGLNPFVVDIDENALKVAEGNGIRTRLLVPGEDLGEAIVDTVIMVEVLEHVPNPGPFLVNALRAARSRVLFTLPCTNDFTDLFSLGLTYAHIAVSDHLTHFSDEDLKALLDTTGYRYEFFKAEPIFPNTAIRILRNAFRWRWMARAALFPVKVMNGLGLIRKQFPSRYYGIIYKDSSGTSPP